LAVDEWWLLALQQALLQALLVRPVLWLALQRV
jgi:hypothetical protein